MSFYATIEGTIRYDRHTDFDAVIRMLRDDGWLDEADHFVDETGDRITEESPNIDREHRSIDLPRALYRNLAGVLPRMFAGGSGKVIWTSTDGCASGGVIVDGVETTYDLGDWYAADSSAQAPDAEADFDEYVDWLGEVEESFFETFSP